MCSTTAQHLPHKKLVLSARGLPSIKLKVSKYLGRKLWKITCIPQLSAKSEVSKVSQNKIKS